MAEHLTFIVSGGRTGTAFLGDLLSEVIEDCHSEHEPDVFYGFDRLSLARLRRFGPWHMMFGRALGLTGVRVLGTRFLTGKTGLATTTRKLREQRAAYHASVPQGLLIESYWAWWMLAGHLDAIFPGAKTIGVIRDPKQWIASYLQHFRNKPRGQLAHILPPGQITAPAVSDPEWGVRWDSLSEVGKLAWLWQFTNGTIDRAAQEGIASVYRFEDVFDPGNTALQELAVEAATFASKTYEVADPRGLIADKRNASGAASEAWREWSVEDRTLVNTLCGPLMDRYGYDPA